MIHIGFTGTRHGMTDAQRRVVDTVICEIIGGDVCLNVSAHHGDCVGADAEFHKIAVQYGARTVGHLPIDEAFRARCVFDEERPPLHHMARNRAIVESADRMIACPHEMFEQKYGGTWATIRMTRKAKKPLVIVLPNGAQIIDRRPS